jgi:hypothetical protein
VRAGRYIVCEGLLNGNSVYTDKSHYPYKGSRDRISGVVVEDLEEELVLLVRQWHMRAGSGMLRHGVKGTVINGGSRRQDIVFDPDLKCF